MGSLPVPGDTVAGKYRIARMIGQGGMGVVFEAFHLRLQRKVAIKMLRPGVLSSRSVVGRFEREARAAATIHGPNVANVLDVDTIDGVPYMAIEYLDGHDLGVELESAFGSPDPCVPITSCAASSATVAAER